MKTRHALAAMLLALLMLLPCGCFQANVEAPVTIEGKTTGRQLIDLKEKWDDGKITPSEYLRRKQEIMNRAGPPSTEPQPFRAKAGNY